MEQGLVGKCNSKLVIFTLQELMMIFHQHIRTGLREEGVSAEMEGQLLLPVHIQGYKMIWKSKYISSSKKPTVQFSGHLRLSLMPLLGYSLPYNHCPNNLSLSTFVSFCTFLVVNIIYLTKHT